MGREEKGDRGVSLQVRVYVYMSGEEEGLNISILIHFGVSVKTDNSNVVSYRLLLFNPIEMLLLFYCRVDSSEHIFKSFHSTKM